MAYINGKKILFSPKVQISAPLDKAFIEGGMTEIYNEDAQHVGDYVFAMSNISSANLPNVTKIGDAAFVYSSIEDIQLTKCEKIGVESLSATMLKEVTLPTVYEVGERAFAENTELQKVTLPKAESIGANAFRSCNNLIFVDLGEKLSNISTQAFNNCQALETLIIRNANAVCQLESTNVFVKCPTNIYVPDALVDTYKTATNWAQFSGRFLPLSQLEE